MAGNAGRKPPSRFVKLLGLLEHSLPPTSPCQHKNLRSFFRCPVETRKRIVLRMPTLDFSYLSIGLLPQINPLECPAAQFVFGQGRIGNSQVRKVGCKK